MASNCSGGTTEPESGFRPTAVVFDANQFSNSRPDLRRLARFAERAHRHGIETWLPEPVLWELAEHLASDWEPYRAATKTIRRTLERSNLAHHVAIDLPTKDTIRDAVISEGHQLKYVEIVPLTPTAAIEGLKDQVLSRSPGKTRQFGNQSVKTGASDSAWLRAVAERAEGKVDTVLFVSADSDLGHAGQAWGWPQIRTCKWDDRALSNMLFARSPATRLAVTTVVDYLAQHSSSVSAEDQEDSLVSALADVSESAFVEVIRQEERGDDFTNYSAGGLSAITRFLGISDVRADDGDSDEQFIYVTARFLANGSAAAEWIDDSYQRSYYEEDFYDEEVECDLILTLSDNTVTDVETDGELRLTNQPRTFPTWPDAYAEQTTALRHVPGLDVADNWSEFPSGTFDIDVPEFEPIRYSLDSARVSLTLGDEVVSVSGNGDETDLKLARTKIWDLSYRVLCFVYNLAYEPLYTPGYGCECLGGW